ncbi:hypothetical protein B0H66DRAFT_623471 [Apodospora peruviana]|uniref:Uncharacterized protein n=1 Tax=Apodospora peruviana TaxID=516989 RepID=A0AAE0M5X0_9PEZI|nr:hypothetical protein B0H66DRAFT_623471 [Apodospora peruviana]
MVSPRQTAADDEVTTVRTIRFEGCPDDLPNHLGWAGDIGNITQIPYFQETAYDLKHHLTDPEYRDDNYKLYFYSTDCKTTSGTTNCTEACLDPKSLFTPRNFYTCVLLAAAALLVQNDDYYVNNSDPATIQAMDQWHVADLSTLDGPGILTNVGQCIATSCVRSTLGECGHDVRKINDFDYSDMGVYFLPNVTNSLDLYCDGFDDESIINPDIAGPGVVLSYLIQTSLALLFFFLIKFFTRTPRVLISLFTPCNHRAKETAHNVQTYLASSRYSAAVRTTLVEFQEVQLYFVGAIQVATFISFDPDNPNTGSANATSFASAVINSTVVNILSLNTVYTVLLTQICLQRDGNHWLYIFLLMSAIYALGLAVAYQAPKLMPPIDALWAKFNDEAPIPACGGNASPMTYCNVPFTISSTWESKDDTRLKYALVCTVVYMALLVDQAVFMVKDRLPSVAARIRKRMDRIDKRYPRTWKCLSKKVWPKAIAVYWFLLEVTMLYNIFRYFTTLMQGTIEAGPTAHEKYGFGQIIAITVWAPTVVKYTYYNISGIQKGLENRIARNYTIQKDNRPEAADAETKLPRWRAESNADRSVTFPLVSNDRRYRSESVSSSAEGQRSRAGSGDTLIEQPAATHGEGGKNEHDNVNKSRTF